jgi:REP element-mobilizing transposase RayT
MSHDICLHHRRSIRLQGFDYSRDGVYYITVCTEKRQCLFGDIVDGVMRLNDAGSIAQHCRDEIPVHFPQVKLDEFAIMLNHVYGILVIADSPGIAVGAKNFSPLHGPSAEYPAQVNLFV